MLLVEYSILDNVKIINESKNGVTKLKLLGKFQKCDEQNNNGRIYPRGILESQVKAIQEKIGDRSLVGALDHPANDAIHLSQASHLITKLWVEKNGDVMGEAEILSTPNGKIVKALIGDGVKIGISSRGLGSVSESREGKVVNEDFKLITFDLVSDPSTKGAFPELTESMRENSNRAQTIISKHKKDRVLMTMLESKIGTVLEGKFNDLDVRRQEAARRKLKVTYGRKRTGDYSTDSQWTDDDSAEARQQAAWDRQQAAKKAASQREGIGGEIPDIPANKKLLAVKKPTKAQLKAARERDRKADARRAAARAAQKAAGVDVEGDTVERVERAFGRGQGRRGGRERDDSSTSLRDDLVNRLKEAFLSETGDTKRRNKAAKRERDAAKGRLNPDITLGQTVAARKAAKYEPKFSAAASVRAGRETTKAEDAAKASVGPSKRDKLKARLAFKKNTPRKKEPGRTQSTAEYRNDIVRGRSRPNSKGFKPK